MLRVGILSWYITSLPAWRFFNVWVHWVPANAVS